MILLKKGCREHRITETHVLNRELQSNIGVSYQPSYILEHGPTKLKPLFNGQLMYQNCWSWKGDDLLTFLRFLTLKR